MDEAPVMPEEWRRERDAVLRAIVEANPDLGSRLRDAQIAMLYDAEEDHLTLVFGEPREALTETINNELALRVDANTMQVCGIEVLGLRGYVQRRPQFVPCLIAVMQQPGTRVESVPPGDLTLLAGDGIRELVEA